MTDRLELTVADMHPADTYVMTTACIIPRPIAWVSTRSEDGVDNVAPHSFNTVAGIDPLTMCFTSVGHKDTVRNCRATGEFVLHIGSESQTSVMNDSATAFGSDLSEYDEASIEREPSVTVKPPRIAGAPIALECRVSGEYAIGSSVMVFGEVLHFAIARSVMAADGKPDARLVAPVARLGRNEWSRLGEVFDLARLSPEEWDAGSRTAKSPF